LMQCCYKKFIFAKQIDDSIYILFRNDYYVYIKFKKEHVINFIILTLNFAIG